MIVGTGAICRDTCKRAFARLETKSYKKREYIRGKKLEMQHKKCAQS